MPKRTFYKIAEEKQNRIAEAAKDEFLNVPYSKVSINKIIKKAGIPRGSFYQYFEDKEDLFYYVIDEQKNVFQKILIREIDKADGDLFMCLMNNVDSLVSFVYTDKSGLVQRILADPKTFETIWRVIVKGDGCPKHEVTGWLNKVDSSKFNVESQQELEAVIEIIGAVVRDSIRVTVLNADTIPPRIAKKLFKNKIKVMEKYFSK